MTRWLLLVSVTCNRLLVVTWSPFTGTHEMVLPETLTPTSPRWSWEGCPGPDDGAGVTSMNVLSVRTSAQHTSCGPDEEETVVRLRWLEKTTEPVIRREALARLERVDVLVGDVAAARPGVSGVNSRRGTMHSDATDADADAATCVIDPWFPCRRTGSTVGRCTGVRVRGTV